MKTFIKIFDEATALKLKESGFSFMKEQINKVNVYVFAYSEELQKLIHSSFADIDIIQDNKLSF